MSASNSKFDQALRDLLISYNELEDEISAKFGGDDGDFGSAISETIEASLDTAIDDSATETIQAARLATLLLGAVESLDPDAFEEVDEEDDIGYGSEDTDDDYIDDIEE